MTYDKVKCEKCGQLSDAHYLLSTKTKALWVHCLKCGLHAMSYNPNYHLPWRPSQPFIKEVGKDEAERLSKEAELNNGVITSRSDIIIPGVKQPGLPDFTKTDNLTFYCDAGVKNNGEFGKQEAVIVVTDGEGKILIEKQIGDKTNNEGELNGIIEAAKIAQKGALILSDSDLSIKLIKLDWTTKIDRLKLLTYDAIILLKKKEIKIEWIPREKNLAGHYIEKKYSL